MTKFIWLEFIHCISTCILVVILSVFLSGSNAASVGNRNSWGRNLEINAPLWSSNFKNNDSFDFFVFTQQWASSVCIDANMTHEHKCSYYNNITTWTVHGLWPTRKGSHEPSFCNNTLKFNDTALEPIYGRLLKYWPNVFTDTPEDDFWVHEWTKHGTCAIEMPELNSELKFFNFTLNLNRKFDLLNLLQQQGLKPSNDHVYQYVEVLSALTKAVGAKTIVQCTYDEVTKTQYIAQIEICLSKSYQVIDCEDSVALRKRHRSVGDTTISTCQNAMVGYLPLR